MRTGTEFQCEIETCALGGDGIARVDGEVVFLPGTLPGEKLIGRITAEKKNFSRARPLRRDEPAPGRTRLSVLRPLSRLPVSARRLCV